MVPSPWCWVLLVVLQGFAVWLTYRDPGWEPARLDERARFAAMWPLAAAPAIFVGTLRGFGLVEVVNVGAAVTLAAVLGTGLRPAVLIGAPIGTGGRPSWHLWIRRASGALTLLVLVIVVAAVFIDEW